MNKEKLDYQTKCKEILKSHNVPITRPRLLLLEILLKNKGPVKVEDVVKLSNGRLAISSVYRIINFLKSYNFISEFQTLDNTKVIELLDQNSHHHHIFCKSCGLITDIELSEQLESLLQAEIQNIEFENDISVSAHSLELFSICTRCQI